MLNVDISSLSKEMRKTIIIKNRVELGYNKESYQSNKDSILNHLIQILGKNHNHCPVQEASALHF